MSTFSPNLQIEEVARNADVGVWDTPTNNNWTLMDSVCGAIATIGLNNANVVLSGAQFQSENITFNSTLTGSVIITFPTSFTKPYTIGHFCTGSSAFTITCETTAAGGQVIAIPPGQYCDIINDGTNLKFKGLPHVGSYWDYAGSSTPNWNDACTVKPWLNCDGTTFSSATYPALAVVLGSTTLPNSKGRNRFALDQGAGLISTSATGFSGTGVGATAGAQASTLITANLPAYTPSGSVSGNTPASVLTLGAGGAAPTINSAGNGFNSGNAISATFTGNPQGGISQAFTNLPPAYIGGLTLIRSA